MWPVPEKSSPASPVHLEIQSWQPHSVISSLRHESQRRETGARGVSRRMNGPWTAWTFLPVISDICGRGPCNYGKEFEIWLRKKKIRHVCRDLSDRRKIFASFWDKRWGVDHLDRNYLISWHGGERYWGRVKWVTAQRMPAQNQHRSRLISGWLLPENTLPILCKTASQHRHRQQRHYNPRERMDKIETVLNFTFSTWYNEKNQLNLQMCI